MAITFEEHYESRKITAGNTNRSAEFKYIVRGTDNEVAVKGLIASSTAATYDGLVRGDYSIEPVHIDTTSPDACIMQVTVHYVEPTAPQAETDAGTFSFDTSGGTQHITQSLSQVDIYTKDDAFPPDLGGAIGVTRDSVEGVDIAVPVYSFSETHYFADSVVNDTYKGKLFRLTGKVNNASFKGCAAGECLFLGASGSKRGGEKWEITFKFAASPNVTNKTIGSITGINKKGWEYLWVRYTEQVDDTANALVMTPQNVVISKVYDDGNFADLGIGT
jgi:hypothetical protein